MDEECHGYKKQDNVENEDNERSECRQEREDLDGIEQNDGFEGNKDGHIEEKPVPEDISE